MDVGTSKVDRPFSEYLEVWAKDKTEKEIYIDDTPSDYSDALILSDAEYEKYLKELKEAVKSSEH